jgi:outer membrane protein assembly factor BamD
MALRVLSVLLLTVAAACSSIPKPGPDAPPEERLRYAWALLERGSYYSSQQAFEDLIFSAPGSAIIDSAHYGLAECYFGMDNFIQAVSEYKTVVSSFPRSGLVDDAAFRIGVANWEQSMGYKLDQTETLRSIEAFRAFVQDYPASDRVEEALGYLRQAEDKIAMKTIYQAESYLKLGTDSDRQAAVMYFSEAIRDFPSSGYMPRAIFGLGETYYRMGEVEYARQTLAALLAEYPDSEYAERARKLMRDLPPPPASQIPPS